MSNHHEQFHADDAANLRVRLAVGSLAVCCGLLGASLARADEGDRGGRHEPPAREMQRAEQREAQRDMQQRAQQQQQAQRPADAQRQLDPRSYEARAEEQRRAMQESSHNAEMSRRAGRLTPDERRDLRRQINEVGQDLYALPPRH
jgi:hypothetical protein